MFLFQKKIKINQVYYLCMLLQFIFVDFHIHFFEMSLLIKK